jgi:hypothetical protein
MVTVYYVLVCARCTLYWDAHREASRGFVTETNTAVQIRSKATACTFTDGRPTTLALMEYVPEMAADMST